MHDNNVDPIERTHDPRLCRKDQGTRSSVQQGRYRTDPGLYGVDPGPHVEDPGPYEEPGSRTLKRGSLTQDPIQRALDS